MELVRELDEGRLERGNWVAYARRRLVEALVEAWLALDFLREGFHRNAAGKAFQAWKALLAAYTALELERLRQAAEDREDRRLLADSRVLRMPTSAAALKRVSQLLEKVGHPGIAPWTAVALGLHQYQYNGLDPEGALSPYASTKAVAADIVALAKAVKEYALRLRDRAWSDAAERASRKLEERLKS